MTVDEAAAAIGRQVIYSSHDGQRDVGVIVRVNASYVFVRYSATGGAVATYPGLLSFELDTAARSNGEAGQ